MSGTGDARRLVPHVWLLATDREPHLAMTGIPVSAVYDLWEARRKSPPGGFQSVLGKMAEDLGLDAGWHMVLAGVAFEGGRRYDQHGADGDAADARLCYVEDNRAYFTTGPLEGQRGIDWEDVPYEMYAGPPKGWRASDGEPAYRLYRVYYGGPYRTPDGGPSISRYSVKTLNAGAAPWLVELADGDGSGQDDRDDGTRPGRRLATGATLTEFRRFLRETGGAAGVATEFDTPERGQGS